MLQQSDSLILIALITTRYIDLRVVSVSPGRQGTAIQSGRGDDGDDAARPPAPYEGGDAGVLVRPRRR